MSTRQFFMATTSLVCGVLAPGTYIINMLALVSWLPLLAKFLLPQLLYRVSPSVSMLCLIAAATS